MRSEATRVAAALLGVFFLVGGAGFLVAVVFGALPAMRLFTAWAALVFGWWFLSHGLGWHRPFRRRAPEAAGPPEA